jgi:putative PIN family toxin of toxin-antitoxin system
VRAVLDSSVLVAAYISRAGVCADLLEDILMDHEWVISHFILDELVRKLKEKFSFPDSEIAEIRESIVGAAETVEPSEVHPESCRDPNDLPVLGTAVAGRADVLITVDKDLLDLKTHCGTPIIRPGEFWRRIEPDSNSPGIARPSDDQDTPGGQPPSEG